jgi:CubicO group peptidase (beta-lactamase class C family)
MKKLTDMGVPGNSISIYYKNDEVFRHSCGFSDRENNIPMNGDELFNIYSCSKVATVVAALQLFEKGCFLLDDPLYEYVPEFREMYVRCGDDVRPAEKHITIKNLFTMTAGLGYIFRKNLRESAMGATDGKMNTLSVVKEMAKEPLYFEPGEKWNYSFCHDVLAGVVEVISGKKFRDYVKENIFEPLGMKNSYYHKTPEIEKRMAQQYHLISDESGDIVSEQQAQSFCCGEKVEKVNRENSLVFGPEYDSGGAGIITKVSDYARFANCLANFGETPNGERILSKSTVDLMRKNQLDSETTKYFDWSHLEGYGYGLGVRTMINPARGGVLGSVGEFGWGGAAGATILVDPDRKLGVFYTHHMLNPLESYYQPRLRNVIYASLD